MKTLRHALALMVMVVGGPAAAQTEDALIVQVHWKVGDATPAGAGGGSWDAGPLTAAVAREGRLLAAAMDTRVVPQAAQRGPQDRGWVARHPVLFGTLVGAGAGAVAAAVMENELFCSGGDEDCFFHGGGRILVGAGFGAGLGAVVGVLVGR